MRHKEKGMSSFPGAAIIVSLCVHMGLGQGEKSKRKGWEVLVKGRCFSKGCASMSLPTRITGGFNVPIRIPEGMN